MSNVSKPPSYSSQGLVELIHTGHSEQACSIIDDILMDKNSDLSRYCELVNVLLEIPDYKRAKNIFESYLSATGEVLVCDYTLEDIINEEQEALPLRSVDDAKSFRRMSVWERGHFSNEFILNPITNIDISEHLLYVKRKYSKPQTYTWSEIGASFITHKYCYKSYGAGTGGKYLKKTLHLIARGKEYKIDVSASFPDFKKSNAMITELEKYLSIPEVPKRV